VCAFGVEGNAGAGDGFMHEGCYGGVVEHGGVGQHDVSDYVATAFEDAGGIGKARALEEKEADPLGIKGDGEDAVGSAFSGAEAYGERVVVVVDELEGGWIALAHFVEDCFSEFGHLRCELGKEAGELALGV